jgi:hypothetical protein
MYILLAIYISRCVDTDTACSYTHGVYTNSRFTNLKPIDHNSGSIFFLLSPAKIVADPHMGKRQLFTDLVEVSARYPEIQIASSSKPSPSSSSSPVKEDIGTA